MSVEKFLFGKLGKSDIYSYIIKNHSGAFVEILDFGGRVRRIVVPDKNGELSNVVLGCDSPQGYLEPGHEYYGAVIGRCATESIFIIICCTCFLGTRGTIISTAGERAFTI